MYIYLILDTSIIFIPHIPTDFTYINAWHAYMHKRGVNYSTNQYPLVTYLWICKTFSRHIITKWDQMKDVV